jgi:acylglycerol lipase
MRKLCVSWVNIVLCGAAGALGCASAPYSAARAPVGGDRVPPDVVYYRGTIDGAGGLKLHEQCWHPTGRSKAVVVLVHDLKDHSGRYRELGVLLANRGLSLCGIDLRGHGYSEGVRDHIESVESVVTDVEILVKRIKDREKGKPVFLLGQGFGASVAGVYALEGKAAVDGVILSAPTLRENVKRGERMGIRAYAILLPRSQRYDVELARFSKDKRVIESLQNDALVYGGKPSASTAGEVLRASDVLQKRSTDLNVPLLVLLGTADQMTAEGPVKALHEKAATSDKKLQTYEGLSHALFHETGRNLVINDVTDWIATHVEAAEEKAAGAQKEDKKDEPAAPPPAPAAAAAPAAEPAPPPALAEAPAKKPALKKAALKKAGARSKRR